MAFGDSVVLVGGVSGEKVQLVVTVSKPLLGQYKAGDIVKKVAEVVGGSGGGRPDMAQAGGYTPLHQAAAAGLEELTRILLEAGADPSRLCDQGKTPADYARDRKHEGVQQQLSVARF